MNNLLEHNGYYGTVEYSSEDGVLFGQVVGINSLISYEGESVAQLKEDFEGAVDEYIELCSSKGIAPEKAYKGTFNIRISPELHKKLVIISSAGHKTLNATVEEALEKYVKAQ